MIVVLVGLGLAWAVMLWFGGMEFDRGLYLLLHADGQPAIAAAASWLTELGGALVLVPVTLAACLWLLVRRAWRSAVILVVVTFGGRLLVSLQKEWVDRVRPDPQGHLVPVESLSFPSAHAANATIVWVALAFLLTRTPAARAAALWAAVWLALLVGASRVVLGVHWPSDVIGGWALGLFWTLVLLRLSGVPLDEGTAKRGGSLNRPEESHGQQSS